MFSFKKKDLCVFACHMCMGSLGGQKKVLGPLELELQDVVSIPVLVLRTELEFWVKATSPLSF